MASDPYRAAADRILSSNPDVRQIQEILARYRARESGLGFMLVISGILAAKVMVIAAVWFWL